MLRKELRQLAPACGCGSSSAFPVIPIPFISRIKMLRRTAAVPSSMSCTWSLARSLSTFCRFRGYCSSVDVRGLRFWHSLDLQTEIVLHGSLDCVPHPGYAIWCAIWSFGAVCEPHRQLLHAGHPSSCTELVSASSYY